MANIKIPDFYNDILRSFDKNGQQRHALTQNRIIAGGAIRDLYFGKDADDIDVFVQVNGTATPTLCQKEVMSIAQSLVKEIAIRENFNSDFTDLVLAATSVTLLGKDPSDFDDTCESINDVHIKAASKSLRKRNGYYGHDGIMAVVQMDNILLPHPVQFVCVEEDPKTFVRENFDVGLCIAHYDGHHLCYPREFMHDANNKLLTVRGEGFSLYTHKFLSRLQKIQNKYPTHKVVLDFDQIKINKK